MKIWKHSYNCFFLSLTLIYMVICYSNLLNVSNSYSITHYKLSQRASYSVFNQCFRKGLSKQLEQTTRSFHTRIIQKKSPKKKFTSGMDNSTLVIESQVQEEKFHSSPNIIVTKLLISMRRIHLQRKENLKMILLMVHLEEECTLMVQ